MRVCTVCARGGSKGVAGKNLRRLGGETLVARTVGQARDAGLFDSIAISSDEPAIREEALAAGADTAVARPSELATDSAAKHPAIAHCVAAVEARYGAEAAVICDLAATAPLRAREDIAAALDQLERGQAASVLSARPARASPYFNLVEPDSSGRLGLAKPLDPPIVRRQDAPPCYELNGAVYVWRRGPFMAEPKNLYPSTELYVMPEARALDIDSEQDLAFAEFLLAHG